MSVRSSRLQAKVSFSKAVITLERVAKLFFSLIIVESYELKGERKDLCRFLSLHLANILL